MHTSPTTQGSPPTPLPDLVGVLVVLLHPSTPADQQRFDQLQTLRRVHDQAFERWRPHITLVPPFTLSTPRVAAGSSAVEDRSVLDQLVQLHATKLEHIVQAAAGTCSRFEQHRLLLDQVSTFPLRKYTNVHLRPAPTNFRDKRSPEQSGAGTEHASQRIVGLQSELTRAVAPLIESNARRRETFKPHVSVGQSTSPKATWLLCRSAEEVLRLEGGAGLLCDVDRVQLMIKPKGLPGAYNVHEEMLLASTSKS